MSQHANAQAGDLLRLEGVTRKGKNRIREARTDRWRVLERRSHVACLNGREGLRIRPVKAADSRHDRWIDAHSDLDFRVVSVGEPLLLEEVWEGGADAVIVETDEGTRFSATWTESELAELAERVPEVADQVAQILAEHNS